MKLWLAAAATLLSVSAVLALLPRPPVDNAVGQWLPENSTRATTYGEFQEQFGTDDVVIILLEGGSARARLAEVQTLSRALLELHAVSEVVSASEAYPGAVDAALGASGAPHQHDELAARLRGPLNESLRLFLPDSHQAAVYALCPLGPSGQRAALHELLDERRQAAAHEGIALRAAGAPLLNLELDRAGAQVETMNLPALVVLSALLLLLLTRSLAVTVAILVPVGLGVLGTEGAYWLTGMSTNLLTNIAKPLLFVLLVATGVHVAEAWQELRRDGADRWEAARRAAREKTQPVVLALVTTAIGFGSLAVSSVPPVYQFGLFSGVGLLFGIPLLLVLLPALLGLLGGRGRPRATACVADVAAATVSHSRAKGPLYPLLGVAALLLGMGAFTYVETNPHAIRYFGEQHPLRQDHDALAERGLGLYAVEIVVERPDGVMEPQVLNKLDALASHAERESGVRSSIGLPLIVKEAVHRTTGEAELPSSTGLALVEWRAGDALAPYLSTDGRKARLSLVIETLDADELRRLEQSIVAKARALFGSETRVTMTGNYPLLLQTQAELLSTLKQSLLITALLMQIVFIFALRSLGLALAVLLPNLLPVALGFAVMLAGDIRLDVGTSMTAAVALGIAVDDTLHFALAWKSYGLRRAARSTGQAIIVSSLVIAAGFLSLVPSGFAPTRNFGILCASAMLSALAANLLVLPPVLGWFARARDHAGQKPQRPPEADLTDPSLASVDGK